jgi:hypothetical protein
MERELNIKISIDKNTGELVVINREFDGLSASVKKTATNVDTFSARLKDMAHASVGIYAIKQAFDVTIAAGFTFNKTMEDSIAGLSALTVATSSNISSLGNHLSITQKYNLAMQESTQTAAALNKINAETPHSLSETTQIYKSLYVGMKNAGASNEEMIHLTKQLSIASGSAGIELNSLLSGVDGLANGTVEVASDFGRFLGALGLTNEVLKSSTDVVELLESKLGEFKVLDTMTVATSNFENAWSQLAGTLTRDIFEVSKESIKGATTLLDEYTGQVHAFLLQFKNIEEIQSAEDINIKLLQLQRDLNEEKSVDFTFMWNSEKKERNENIKNIEAEIAALESKRAAQNGSQETLVKSGFVRDDNKAAQALLKIEEYSQKQKEDYAKKQNESAKSFHDEEKKRAADAIKLEEEKQKARNDLDKMSLEIRNNYFKERETKVNLYFANINAKTEEQTKLAEAKAKLENDFEKTMQDNYISMLDTQIALANSTQDWQNGLSGVSAEIMAVSNALGKMNANELQAKKAQASLDARYTEQFTKYAGDELKTKKLVASYEAEQAAIKDQTRANEVNGYATLAGAMSQAFEEGSKGAEIAMAAQQSLALYNAVTAVTGAWASAPFPANLPAVLTTTTAVGALLSQIGTSFGESAGLFGTTTSTDAFSAQKENLGTGSVLGDASKATESIKESLSLLEDLARPEFRLLSMMNDSLMSIDRALAGTAANISQSGGFATGEGFTSSSSSTSLLSGSANYNAVVGTALAFTNPLTAVGFAASELSKKIFGENPVSNIIDSFVGSITSYIGSIGGSNTIYSLQDAGITFGAQYIQDAMDSIVGKSFQTVLKSKRTNGLFSSSTKNTVSTTFGALDENIGREFELILGSLYDTVLYATEGLNLATSDIENDLADFVVNIGKISLKGKTGEEIQQQLTDVFGKIGDELAADALNETLTGFQQIGEGLFETLVRVSGGMQEAEYYIKRLGSSFDAVDYTSILNQQGDVGFEALSQSIIEADKATYGLNNGVVQMIETFNASAEELYSAYLTFEQLRLQIEATNHSVDGLTSSMLLGAGGADALTSGLSDYIDNFLSESEQFSYHSNVLSKEFEKMNLTMPTTIDGFRSIVEGIDTSSEAGQELYGRLITLSGEFSDVFADLTISITEAQKSITEAQKSITDAWLSAYSPLSTLQKTEYANNVSFNPEASGMSAIDASYLALQTAAATATRDEDIALAFSDYVSKLEEQTADASRQDIVDVLERVSNTLNDIVDRVERIEQTA